MSCKLDHVLSGHHGLQFEQRVAAGLRCEDAVLAGAFGVADAHADQETVELILREIIGALELERVLRRDDHERPLERHRLIFDAHLLFAHRLEQRAWVRGVVRLISSASTMLAKIGPGLNSNVCEALLKMETPRISPAANRA
jgi:hypothetical protein